MISNLRDRVKWVTGLGLLTLGLAGCTTNHQERAPGTAVHDAALSKRVAGALRQDPEYRFDDVRVNIHQTTAQLGGFVDTPRHRERAEEVAAQVPGVENIINNITLKEEPNGPEEPPARTSALRR
jgi:osmotically-inducible protein OsmY